MKSKMESDGHKLNVVEFGCASGGSSIDPLNAIKEASDNRKIKAIMNDLPLNNWEALKETLAKNVPEVEVEICAQSMYKEAVAPKASLDLAYSCFTQHWLSVGIPADLPLETGALWGNQLAQLPEYKDIYDKWATAARNDWARFMELRAEELRPGGIVVMHIQSAYVNGEMPAGLSHGCQVAKKQCLEEGIFTEAEARKLCMPEYGKNMLEIVTPFASAENLKKWDLLEYHQLPGWALAEDVVDPSVAKLSESEQARRAVDLARAFMDSSIEVAFTDVTESVKKEKVDKFWEKVYEFGKDDSSKIDANFGATLLAFERK